MEANLSTASLIIDPMRYSGETFYGGANIFDVVNGSGR